MFHEANSVLHVPVEVYFCYLWECELSTITNKFVLILLLIIISFL